MCRVLLVKSEKPKSPVNLLNQFADMCEKSRALNGDWQGDGWGISWFDERQQAWQLKRSLRPIWEKGERRKFPSLPKVRVFSAHARSATFDHQLGDVSYNQPYLSEDRSMSFVFNGHLKGVRLSKKVPGKSGAQKLWNLLQDDLQNQKIDKAVETDKSRSLENLKNKMIKNTRELLAMNIGLADHESISALCLYKPNDKKPDYHKLWYLNSVSLKLICSEPLLCITSKDREFKKADNGEIVTLS
jgi:predicted glutamine amidotransferase